MFAAVVAVAAAVVASDRPIVGVWAHPSSSDVPACGGDCEYIAASYVKWVESAGGRVVPIRYNSTTSYYDEVLTQVNGILFPGGSAPLPESARYLYARAKQLQDRGVHFPIWGTCLGFEWLAEIIANTSVLEDCKADNVSLALQLTSAAAESRLLGGSDKKALRELLANAANPVTMNNHQYSVTPALFEDGASQLAKETALLSVNKDTAGKPFASTFEARTRPVYAVQWHPEKNNYEWGVQPGDRRLPLYAINHSPEAVIASQLMANFFVDEARRNGNQFATPEEEEAAMVDNYPKVTFLFSGLYQKYFFPSFK